MPDTQTTRIENVRRALAAHDPAIDALLLTDIGNQGYVSGFTGSTAQALITPDEALFITDSRYTLRALAECQGFQDHRNAVRQRRVRRGAAKRPQGRARTCDRLGFEAGHVTVAAVGSVSDAGARHRMGRHDRHRGNTAAGQGRGGD